MSSHHNSNNNGGNTNNLSTTTASNHAVESIMDHIDDRLFRYRAKRLRFLINGDQYFAGIKYALNTEKIRSFDALLNDLTCTLSMDHLKLCKGVRYIFSQQGQPVADITDFQDGQTYICSSTDSFVATNYKISNGALNWLVRNSACISSSERVRVKRQINTTSPGPQKHQQPLSNQDQSYASHDSSGSNNNNTINNNNHNNNNSINNNNSSQNLINRSTGNKTPLHQHRQTRQQQQQQTPKNNQSSITSHNNDTRTNLGKSQHHSSNRNVNRTPNKAPAASANSATFSPQPKQTPKRTIAVQNQNNHNHTNNNTNLRQQQHHQKQSPNKNEQQQQQQPLPCQEEQQTNVFGNEVIERYEIGGPIGDGHFSVVYRCKNKETNEDCALKLIDKLKCRGRDDMIYNEVKILKELSHPNIVKLIEEFDYSMQLYLILELVQDGDLFDAIANVTRPFNEVQVATMIFNLSSALTYLHEQGIVHRDIKPENLLISKQKDGSQSVKLADFGLAVEVNDDNRLYSVCGTAFYVSPEMLNESGYDFKVDVWSTGVICFILLCGYPPFTSENESNQDELFDAILAGDFHFAPPYWSKISQHAKNLIKCMLTVDPDKRFSAEQVFKHPWTMGTSSNFDGIEPMNLSRKIALRSATLTSSSTSLRVDL